MSGTPEPPPPAAVSRRLVIGLLVVAVVATAAGFGLWYVISPSTDAPVRLASTTTSTAPATTTTTPPTTTTTAPAPTTSTTTTADPGQLPQTAVFPSTSTPEFQSEMQALFSGVLADSVPTALASYFPESAYVQLKSIVNPASDYTNRLVHDFALDIGAAHELFGPDAANVQFVSVNVPSQYGHWVPPGICDNRDGYFEVANSRVVYQEDNQVRSFGVASMISWRGTWYVVHLGAILRSTDEGIVDNPTEGPGTSPDSSTC